MPQSVKLESDTYLDSTGVIMRSQNNTYRKTLDEWAQGVTATRIFSLAGGESVTATINNAARIFVFCTGLSAGINGMINICTNNSGDVFFYGTAPTNISFTSSASNKVTITNTHGSAQCAILALCRAGDMTT